MSLAALATGREISFFSDDLLSHRQALEDTIGGRRILIVGGAGSIGSNTLKTLLPYRPAAVHVVDQSENGLAELVRQYWSSDVVDPGLEFSTLPLDYGGTICRTFLEKTCAVSPYDVVLNFAAIKHVRTEKDPFSALQMFDTNIVKQAHFLKSVRELAPKASYFSVSTDKAANPVSFMGASKRIMEHVMFHEDFVGTAPARITSARFANVAFSNGSLLQSFENRMARGEPIACPKAIKRYFVSLEESGEICTLAAFLAPDRHIVIPKLDPEAHLIDLQKIADAFVRLKGYEPVHLDNEAEARAAVAELSRTGRWPVLLTPADTAGEKPYEEFIGRNETALDIGFNSLSAIHWQPVHARGVIADYVATLKGMINGTHADEISLEALALQLARLEPDFLHNHKASAKNLDQRA